MGLFGSVYALKKAEGVLVTSRSCTSITMQLLCLQTSQFNLSKIVKLLQRIMLCSKKAAVWADWVLNAGILSSLSADIRTLRIIRKQHMHNKMQCIFDDPKLT